MLLLCFIYEVLWNHSLISIHCRHFLLEFDKKKIKRQLPMWRGEGGNKLLCYFNNLTTGCLL